MSVLPDTMLRDGSVGSEDEGCALVRAGRELEVLIRTLEALFVDSPAEVRSPDLLPGRLSGTAREVDVSLRGKVGSIEMLIIIECRDRSARQDVRWIEELSTKREDVGAHMAIAVSRSGFTPAAQSMAQAKGIELRTFEQFETSSPLPFILETTSALGRLEGIEMHFHTQGGHRVTPAAAEAGAATECRRHSRPLTIVRISDGQRLTLWEVWQDVLSLHKDQLRDRPEPPYVRDVVISSPQSRYLYDHDPEPAFLTRVTVHGDFHVRSTPVDPATYLEYRAGENALSYGAQLDFDGKEGPASVSVHVSADKSKMIVIGRHGGRDYVWRGDLDGKRPGEPVTLIPLQLSAPEAHGT